MKIIEQGGKRLMTDQTGWKTPTIGRTDPYNKPRDLATLNRWLKWIRPSSPQWELAFDGEVFYFTRSGHVLRADSFRFRFSKTLTRTTYEGWMRTLDSHVEREASRTSGKRNEA